MFRNHSELEGIRVTSCEANGDNGIRVTSCDSDGDNGIRVTSCEANGDNGIRVTCCDADGDNGIRVTSLASANPIQEFEIQPRNFVQIKKMSSHLHSKGAFRTQSHKKNVTKEDVAKFFDGIDRYSNKKVNHHESLYHVDHIFEIQCFVNIIAMALHNVESPERGLEIFEQLREKLAKIINCNENLNITDKQTNLIKMNVFKSSLRLRWIDHNFSLKKQLQKSNFSKDIDLFLNVFKSVCLLLRNKLELVVKEFAQHYELYNEKKDCLVGISRILNEFDNFVVSLKIEN